MSSPFTPGAMKFNVWIQYQEGNCEVLVRTAICCKITKNLKGTIFNTG